MRKHALETWTFFFDAEHGLAFRWGGTHTVNVFLYDPDTEQIGEEVDVFTVGDFAEDRATREQVVQGIEEYIREFEEEMNE